VPLKKAVDYASQIASGLAAAADHKPKISVMPRGSPCLMWHGHPRPCTAEGGCATHGASPSPLTAHRKGGTRNAKPGTRNPPLQHSPALAQQPFGRDERPEEDEHEPLVP
jgi:hypothetical protein